MGRDLQLTGKALLTEYKRRFSRKSVLAFSRGKDSLSCAIVMIEAGIEVIPVHYFMVPDLPLVEESLDYYERVLFKRRVLRFPHPAMMQWLETGTFQTMATYEIIDATEWSRPIPINNGFNVIRKMVLADEGLDGKKVLNAVGVRQHDSPLRFMSFQKHGPIRESAQSWFPVWDYNKAKLEETIRRSGISLPIDYQLFGRSFDGLARQYLVPIKRHRPEDWRKILEWYPLADVEVWKYERQEKLWHSKSQA
jgi:hypothetical protein